MGSISGPSIGSKAVLFDQSGRSFTSWRFSRFGDRDVVVPVVEETVISV